MHTAEPSTPTTRPRTGHASSQGSIGKARLLLVLLLLSSIAFSGCLQKGGIQRFDPDQDLHDDGVPAPDAFNLTLANVGNHTLLVTWTLTHPSGHIAEARQATVEPGDTYRFDKPLREERVYRLFHEIEVEGSPASGRVTLERNLWGDDCLSPQAVLTQAVDTADGLPTKIVVTTKYGFCL